MSAAPVDLAGASVRVTLDAADDTSEPVLYVLASPVGINSQVPYADDFPDDIWKKLVCQASGLEDGARVEDA